MNRAHYVPVQVEVDRHATLVYFHGDLDGIEGHDEIAHKIAFGVSRNGAKLHVCLGAALFSYCMSAEFMMISTPCRH